MSVKNTLAIVFFCITAGVSAGLPGSCCNKKDCAGSSGEGRFTIQGSKGACFRSDTGDIYVGRNSEFGIFDKGDFNAEAGSKLASVFHSYFLVAESANMVLKNQSMLKMGGFGHLTVAGNAVIRLDEGSQFVIPQHTTCRIRNVHIDLGFGASFHGNNWREGYSFYGMDVGSKRGHTLRMGHNSTFNMGYFVNYAVEDQSALYLVKEGKISIGSHSAFTIKSNAYCFVQKINLVTSGRVGKNLELSKDSSADDENNKYRCYGSLAELTNKAGAFF